MFIEGLPWVTFPEKFKKYLAQVLEMPPSTMRKMGFVLMAAGIFFVYLGKTSF